MSDRDPISVRVLGEDIVIALGRRTPPGAAWHEAIVVNVVIDPRDAQRVGEKAIRRAVQRRIQQERKRQALPALAADLTPETTP